MCDLAPSGLAFKEREAVNLGSCRFSWLSCYCVCQCCDWMGGFKSDLAPSGLAFKEREAVNLGSCRIFMAFLLIVCQSLVC